MSKLNSRGYVIATEEKYYKNLPGYRMDDLKAIEKELYDLMIKSQNKRTTSAPSEYRIDMKGFIR